MSKIANKKYVYVQKLNKNATRILSICNEYLIATSPIVRSALMNEIKRELGNKKGEVFEDVLQKATTLDMIKDYMEKDSFFMTTKEDIVDEAIDFANEYFTEKDEKILINKNGTKSICVKRMYGIKQSQLIDMLGVSQSEASKIFSKTDWLDVFVGKYMKTKIVNCIETNKKLVLDKNSKVKINVSNEYRACGVNDVVKNKRFVNLDVDFIIPIENLDTFTLSTIIVLINMIENDLAQIV